MNRLYSTKRVAVMCWILFIFSLPTYSNFAHAQILNGDFENGINSWTSWSSTYSSDGDTLGLHSSFTTITGSQSNHLGEIKTSALAAPGSISSLSISINQYIRQTFDAYAGDYIKMDLSSTGTVNPGGATPPAYSTVSLSGTNYSQTLNFNVTTLVQTLSFPRFQQDGQYTLTILNYSSASAFYNMKNGTSGMGSANITTDIDNVTLVPEPSIIISVTLGFLCLLVCAWRRRKSTALVD